MQLTASKLVCLEVGEGPHRPKFHQLQGIGVDRIKTLGCLHWTNISDMTSTFTLSYRKTFQNM